MLDDAELQHRAGLLTRELDATGRAIPHGARVLLALGYLIADDRGMFDDDQLRAALGDPMLCTMAESAVNQWERSRRPKWYQRRWL